MVLRRARAERHAVALFLAVAVIAWAPAAFAKQEEAKLGKVKTETASVTVTTSAPISATANCPAGKRAVGGGWFSTAGPTSDMPVVYESVMGADQRSWTTTADRIGSGSAQTLTTEVYCREIKKAIVDVQGTAATPPGLGDAASASATCPGKKQRLLGGGFSSDFGGGGNRAVPFASFKSDAKTWTYSAANGGVNASRLLTAHAYCVKGVKSSKELVGPTTAGTVAASGDLIASTPECEGKKPRLSAGGFVQSQSVLPGGSVGAIRENRIVGDAWQATSRNITKSAKSISLTARALCFQK